MLKPRKDAQLAIRWHAEDLVAIDGIAEREERSRSEIVRFFVRWGIQQYKDFGSLQALELTSLLKLVEKRKGATKVASIEGAQVHREAHIRLQLLTERVPVVRVEDPVVRVEDSAVAVREGQLA